MPHAPYVPQKPSRSTFVQIRKLRYHVREWGDRDAPLLVMLHGWMDVSASFQFTVDAFARDWHVVAPDWRGYGLTAWPADDCYWIPDYLGDLDALLQLYSPDAPVRLVGHSMGGNVGTFYAGVRPDRIASFVNLEGLGSHGEAPDKAPQRLARWLQELREPPVMRTYDSLDAVIGRLQKTNPRLTDARAAFLAEHWSRRRDDGQYEILGDPAHKVVNPYLQRVEEADVIWRSITAPVLWVGARESEYLQRMEANPVYATRVAAIADVRRATVEDAGHMLHHDQPERVAALIEGFVAECEARAAQA